jgi:CO/xanthine dehydrogenase Mo-binding subunit
MSAALSRRGFLQAGGALLIGFSLAPSLARGQGRPAALPGSLNANRMLDAWLRIAPNGTVTILTGKIELGQGIGTALAQIAADELDVDLARIDVVSGDTARTPNEGQTAGSLSVEQSGTALRLACAEARHLLLSAAAARLGVPAPELKVSDGTITAPSGATATYWELTGTVNFSREVTATVKPKPPSEHAWVGKSIARRDIPKKFTGGAAYVQDIRLPRMLFGRVVRPPSPGRNCSSVDEPAARRLSESWRWCATGLPRHRRRARGAGDPGAGGAEEGARWRETAVLPPGGEALYQYMMARPGPPAETVSEKRSPTAAPSVKTLSAVYTRPFQCHASIGPSCAVAQWRDGKLTVWTHSQGVFPLRADLAKVFGVDAKDIRCIHAEGAGCYGHNGADDVALDAALVARATGGRPVKLQWMRDDEFQWEPYGSAMVMKLTGSVDAQGGIVDWTHELWSHPHGTRPGPPTV